MRDMLEPIFGETGAVVAQFVVTLIVVLVLIAIVYWLVRRFAGARFGSIARGRVPRLAIVDAMAIDSRRRLVLVRRDNAEHLILIGGPSDILIEGPIRRVSARHRAEQQAAARAAPQPGEAAPAPEIAVAAQPEPIAAPVASPEPAIAPAQKQPSPPLRTAPQPAPPPPPPLPARRTGAGAGATAATSPLSPEPEADMAEFEPRGTSAMPMAANDQTADQASAQFAEIAHPTAVEPFRRTADDQTVATTVQHETADPRQDAPASTAAPADQTAYPSEDEERRASPSAGDGSVPAATEDEAAEADANPDDDTAAKVSDLEREMAKLLGEIGTKRAT